MSGDRSVESNMMDIISAIEPTHKLISGGDKLHFCNPYSVPPMHQLPMLANFR